MTAGLIRPCRSAAPLRPSCGHRRPVAPECGCVQIGERCLHGHKCLPERRVVLSFARRLAQRCQHRLRWCRPVRRAPTITRSPRRRPARSAWVRQAGRHAAQCPQLANTRSLPALTCWTTVDGPDATASRVPPSSAVTAGAAPAKGTWVMLIPALAASISIGTCMVP